ncbi:MAG: hypothetical protein ACM3SY_19900 [Candidatus Omnitrophota bacterium]
MIKKETRISMVLAFSFICSTVILTLVAYVIHIRPVLRMELQDKIRDVASLIVVLLLITIFYVRRTLYYSPKLIKENFTLPQVLQKWRVIDITLLAVTETLPLCGLVLTFLGVPFDKTFHFFIGAIAMMFLLAPMGIKVRSKLSILREHFPDI